MPDAVEVNFDGLVGPTHNYAGLSFGNVASLSNRSSASNPREAALQGLAKMKALADLGVPQAVLPPHARPAMHALRAVGLTGTDAEVLAAARRDSPEMLHAVSSASAMWTANACTVAPSADTADGRVHLTPANLASKFHRSLEAPTTERVLRAIFRDESRFVVHPPVPGGAAAGDEGAANHTRFCREHGTRGFHLFVYGRDAGDVTAPRPGRFPARQELAASRTVARQHGLDPAATLFIQQSPEAIDAGAFHNDVVAVGHRHVHLCHERAFVGGAATARLIADRAAAAIGRDVATILVPEARVSLDEAVRSYLFNSQLVTLPDGGLVLVAPGECGHTPAVKALLDEIVAGGGPIRQVLFFDLRQSMRNGGGPACLRQRIVLTAAELGAMNGRVLLTPGLHAQLVAWVERHYRDHLAPADLADPHLLLESRRALDELCTLLGLGSVYPFQLP